MTHDKVLRRQIEGEIGNDKDIPRLRAHFQKLLEDSMRDEEMVPLLDIAPAFSLEYKDGTYIFKLTMHGVKIGKEANKWQGMSDGKLYPRRIHKDSSNQS